MKILFILLIFLYIAATKAEESKVDDKSFINLTNDVDDRTNAILNVSPNPSDGLFVVDVDGFAVGVELTLFDSFGKLVLKENISATDYPFKKSIDLSQLSNGVYLLKASDGAKEKFTKLITN